VKQFRLRPGFSLVVIGGEMGEYEELFKFAAKVGSLEGYLYQRDEIESLDNWMDNINTMYQNLPDDIKGDLRKAYTDVLNRILVNGKIILPENLRSRLQSMLLEIEGS
jgi:hypothetical protein